MRVLGGTTSDLARMMFVEGAYMGIPGIIFGSIWRKIPHHIPRTRNDVTMEPHMQCRF